MHVLHRTRADIECLQAAGYELLDLAELVFSGPVDCLEHPGGQKSGGGIIRIEVEMFSRRKEIVVLRHLVVIQIRLGEVDYSGRKIGERSVDRYFPPGSGLWRLGS
jgi:hypothetical protein